MIEIALSLAVIGFALVAIIGILPSGMNVQKENRQETIICQDASIWMESIRNGAQGVAPCSERQEQRAAEDDVGGPGTAQGVEQGRPRPDGAGRDC